MKKNKNEAEGYIVNWTKNAEDDLNEIILFIARNNPQTALNIHKKLRAKADSLNHFPFRGSYVPELLVRNNKEYRQITEPTWRIIYKVDDKTVNILAVIDSRRDILELLLQRFLVPES